MTPSRPQPAGSQRSALDSPWLAAALVVVVVALVVVVLVVSGLIAPNTGVTSSSAPSSGAATASPSPGEPTFFRPTPSPAPSFTAYVVRSGDTLNSIAKQFRTTARSIAWWNRGAYPSLDPESAAYDPNRLVIGWVLMVLPDSVVDENNPPTPSPGPSSAPSPSAIVPAATAGLPALPSPKPSAASLATVIAHGSRTAKTIALTFDMGGRLDPAVDIVQWLIDHGVHATLFPTGKSGTATAQGLAAMELAATRPDLFDFGNHSWDHPDFRTLTAAQLATQLTRTETALVPVVGATTPWFRPPYGGWNASVRAGVAAAGWHSLVMWDVDMIDWRPVSDGGPTAADMAAKLRSKAQGGSIVLMHLGGYNTLAALPGILAAATDLGLQPVTLREMFGK
jgi:peptidoglycan/xylan/chitin deacetylase (PgdA/CDA1 family)